MEKIDLKKDGHKCTGKDEEQGTEVVSVSDA